jgi:hypothetical protein
MLHLKTCVIYCIAWLSPMGTWEVGFCSLEEWLPIVVGNCILKSVCILSQVGNTPLIRLNAASKATGCEIYGKVTSF